LSQARPLCRLEEIPEGEAKAFRVEGFEYEVFVHRHGGGARAFLNSCPHRGTPLDWVPDRFIAPDGEHFLCATHGALFKMADGVCVAGPCAGARLTAVPVRLEGGWVILLG
jgi:nitrite reductase/ring-hydroxylating ferredoxin subunit